MSDSFAVDSRVNLSHSPLIAWLVCLSAGLFFFYEFFQLNVFDVINQPLRDEFGIDATRLSWLSSAFLWANILFLLPAGLILDRYSTRLVILSSMCLCVFATFCLALTHSFSGAFFFRFLSGIGNAFSFLSCMVLISRWFPPRRQALVIGSVVTMAFMGGMMAHTPFAFLNEHFGWRNALFIDGGFGSILLLVIHFMVKDRPPHSVHLRRQKQSAFPHLLKVLGHYQNWLSGFYTSCLNLPIMVLCALWGASYLQAVHHLSQIAASNVVSMIFLGSILGCPIAGWLSDAMGRRKPLMIIGALATLLIVMPLSLGFALSETALNGLFFMLGLFTSTQVISYPLIAESNHSDHTGTATGIASIIIMGGAAMGQILFGWLMQQHAGLSAQTYSIADFQFAMWIFPIAAVAALLAVLLIRETYCRAYH